MIDCRDERCQGSALLLVVGATAALATLATVLLAASLSATETAALRRDGVQARLLAEAGLVGIARAMASGQLRLDVGLTEPLVWDGVLPSPPAGFDALPAGSEPMADAAPGGGCGYRVALNMAVGADGSPIRVQVDGAGAEALLVDALAVGWCGRGRGEIEARFALLPGVWVRRLH
ncbi:MAG: hypothetical protein ACE5HV_17945 [Acidobacteriota bacterium]